MHSEHGRMTVSRIPKGQLNVARRSCQFGSLQPREWEWFGEGSRFSSRSHFLKSLTTFLAIEDEDLDHCLRGIAIGNLLKSVHTIANHNLLKSVHFS